MKQIYLCRHANPTQSGCLGRAESPLSILGKMQSVLLAVEIEKQQPVRLFSSPMQRAVQTAEAFQYPVNIIEDLTERDMGEWNGLSWETIRNDYPDLYQSRATDPSLFPLSAESEEKTAERMKETLLELTRGSEGAIAVITHGCAIKALLSSLSPKDKTAIYRKPIPCGSYMILAEEAGELRILQDSLVPHPEMTGETAERILHYAAPNEAVIRHCEAVAEKVLLLQSELGAQVPALLESAALLHDLCRNQKNHAGAAAALLRKLGYAELAEPVEEHHNLSLTLTGKMTNSLLLILADTLIKEDREVSLDERFAQSRKKCRDAEAVAAWETRYRNAKTIYALYESLKKKGEFT